MKNGLILILFAVFFFSCSSNENPPLVDKSIKLNDTWWKFIHGEVTLDLHFTSDSTAVIDYIYSSNTITISYEYKYTHPYISFTTKNTDYPNSLLGLVRNDDEIVFGSGSAEQNLRKYTPNN